MVCVVFRVWVVVGVGGCFCLLLVVFVFCDFGFCVCVLCSGDVVVVGSWFVVFGV